MIDPALYVEEHPADDPDAPLVVLVHGLLDSSWSFGPVVEQLVPEHHVVTYDRRGWGASEGAEPPTSFDDHVDDLVAVMAGRRGTVIGHSYGGVVSLVAASRHPDLIASLGVYEPSLSWTEVWPERAYIRQQSRTFEKGHFGAGLDDRPRRSREEKARDIARTDHEVDLLERVDLVLGDVTVPTVVGRGELSAPWRLDVINWLSAQLGAEVIVVEGAAHTAHRVQPEAFADFTRRVVSLADQPAAS